MIERPGHLISPNPRRKKREKKKEEEEEKAEEIVPARNLN